jgi:acetate kinase
MEAILVINAGFSSIKFAAYDGTSSPGEMNLIGKGYVALAGAEIEFFVKSANSSHPEIARSSPAGGAFDPDKAMARMLNWLDQHRGGLKLTAVGHRVAHGGQRYPASMLVSDEVLEDLDTLAPPHQSHDLKALRYLRERLATVPQVACFDSALHRSQPRMARAHAPSGMPQAAAIPIDAERMIAVNTLRCTERVPTNAVIHVFPSMAPASRRDTFAIANLTLLAQLPPPPAAAFDTSLCA